MTKVAVITRTKDRPLFLKRAIESVHDQSFSDFVHVIVNDGGDRGDIEDVVESFEDAVKSKITLYHRNEPSNAPDTIFNECIDQVDSMYFAIHDDDDTWHIDFLKDTTSYLDANPEHGAVVVRANKIIEKVADDSIIQISVKPWMADLKAVSLYLQCIDNQLTPIATLYKREAYEMVGKFDSSLPVVGDWEFGVRLLQSYQVDFLNPGHPLANYHHREYQKDVQGNTSFSGNEKHRYYTNMVMNRYLRKELAEGKLGVGYIMSQLKYSQANTAALIGRFMPKGIVERLKRRVSN